MIRSVYFTYLQQYRKKFPDQFEDVTQSGLDEFLSGGYGTMPVFSTVDAKQENDWMKEEIFDRIQM